VYSKIRNSNKVFVGFVFCFLLQKINYYLKSLLPIKTHYTLSHTTFLNKDLFPILFGWNMLGANDLRTGSLRSMVATLVLGAFPKGFHLLL
jgi:hypothetical protein